MIKKLATGLMSVAFAVSCYGTAAPANDNASNYPGGTWDGTTNGGTGFSTWTFNSNGAGNHYIGATADGNPAFGLFAGGSNNGDSSSVDRSFANGSMMAGDTFSLTLGISGVFAGDMNTAPGVAGLNLLSSGSPVFTFKFTGGGTEWQLNDGGGDFGTGIPFAANTPISFSFTYNGGNNYSLSITEGTSTFTAPNFTANSNLTNLSGFRVFSNAQGAGENIGFNGLSVTTAVPEPSTFALLAGPALLGGLFFVRRRRVS